MCACSHARSTECHSFSGEKQRIWDCKTASKAPLECSSLQKISYGESCRTNIKLKSNFI